MNKSIPNNKTTFMATLSNLVKTLSYYVESIFDMTFDYESMIDTRHTMEHLCRYDIPSEMNDIDNLTLYDIYKMIKSILSNTHMPFGN